MTPHQLAEDVGRSSEQIARILRGQPTSPTTSHRILAALGYTTAAAREKAWPRFFSVIPKHPPREAVQSTPEAPEEAPHAVE